MKVIIEKTRAYERSYNKKLRREKIVKDGVDHAINLMRSDKIVAEKIVKNLWPESYQKFLITNLWKYEVKSYRLIYTLRIESTIKKYGLFDILTHKEYDKLFGFHTS